MFVRFGDGSMACYINPLQVKKIEGGTITKNYTTITFNDNKTLVIKCSVGETVARFEKGLETLSIKNVGTLNIN